MTVTMSKWIVSEEKPSKHPTGHANISNHASFFRLAPEVGGNWTVGRDTYMYGALISGMLK